MNYAFLPADRVVAACDRYISDFPFRLESELAPMIATAQISFFGRVNRTWAEAKQLLEKEDDHFSEYHVTRHFWECKLKEIRALRALAMAAVDNRIQIDQKTMSMIVDYYQFPL